METLIITAVERQKRNAKRFNIYADGEYIASLGEEACASNGIKPGARISKDALGEAVAQDNERYAFDAAAAMLSYISRTRSEVKGKLASKNIDEKAAEAALAKLESYGYIDDAAYAAEYVRSAMASGKSRRAAEYGLKQKGLSRGVITEAMQAYTDEAEEDAARKGAEALRRAGKDRKHIYAALARRGFDYDTISKLLPEDE
jgi:regulatory protein